jgi:hypothetical protein
MNLEDYDFDRLLGLGYTEKATGELKDACWKGYTAVGLKKKGGRTVPNCVPIKKSKSDHAEEMKRKPFIAGPSAGSPSFGEEEETDDFAQCVKPNGSTYGTKGDCQPPNKPLHHSLKKTEKKKKEEDEKMCSQYQPWAPLGMQNVVVPCKNLGIK